MNKYNFNEPNFLRHYFHEDSATHQIIHGMREAFLSNEHMKFNSGLIERARAEISTKAKALDASTYPFAQDLVTHLYSECKKRVIMLVEGRFLGDGNIESVIPIDLGNNPYFLFKDDEGNTTIDHRVTMEKTADFISEHSTMFSRKGYSSFEIDKSRFFYFRENDLIQFLMANDQIDFKRLIPLISSTKGYVVLDRVDTPSPEQYVELSPIHTSYRLKKSLERKLLRKSSLPRGVTLLELDHHLNVNRDDSITDWVGHRPVVSSLEDVYREEAFLKTNPSIGNSNIEYLFTKDRYEKPTESGFKAKMVVVRVSTNGYEPSTREIQLVDRITYFDNELKKGKTSHIEREKKQSNIAKNKRKLYEYYNGILQQIFAGDRSIIKIK